jgi:trk system potassium uptake protein TrkA
MRVIIIGAGAVGSQLAEQLSTENHDVVIIETDKERLRKLQDEFDILVQEGNGASPKVLSRAGIDRCDLLMALTNFDEINLVASLTACQHGVPFKIARVSNMDYYLLDNWLSEEKNLGVDLLVNPEFECAIQIMNHLNVPGATDVAELGGGRAMLAGLEVVEGAPCLGETLADFKLKVEGNDFLVAAITRDGQTIIPTGQTNLELGDLVYLVCMADHLDDIYDFAGVSRKPVNRVLILGGSKVAVYIAKMLERNRIRATLIENDEEIADQLAEELDSTLVIHGDSNNVELWEMEGLDETDAFLALTKDDEENLLTGLIARNNKVPVVIALLEKLDYVPLVNKVGVNTAVSSRLAIVDVILKYVRRGNILSVATLKGNEAEIIEFMATDKCKLLGKPIRDLKVPPQCLFGLVARGRDVFIPTGHTVFEVDDKVTVIAGPNAKRRLEELFA